MKISHESPLALLGVSRLYNDFDYALVHLFDQYPEYYKFFEESLSIGRTVILDNSIFELGTAFDSDEFYKWTKKLIPTYYIIPDVFDNTQQTIQNVKDWFKNYHKIDNSSPMVVCQGSTPSDFLYCYQEFIKMNMPMIAFPVNSKSYLNGKEYSPKNMMEGRLTMIGMCMYWKRLYSEVNTKHHLLGLSLPQEVALYKNVPEIVSIDTSNPVLHGMEGIWYDDFGQLQSKSTNKMHEMMEWTITDKMFDAISHNITKFRSHVN